MHDLYKRLWDSELDDQAKNSSTKVLSKSLLYYNSTICVLFCFKSFLLSSRLLEFYTRQGRAGRVVRAEEKHSVFERKGHTAS